MTPVEKFQKMVSEKLASFKLQSSQVEQVFKTEADLRCQLEQQQQIAAEVPSLRFELGHLQQKYNLLEHEL
jgi:hypothetical protein